jgi:hypothetical protein
MVRSSSSPRLQSSSSGQRQQRKKTPVEPPKIDIKSQWNLAPAEHRARSCREKEGGWQEFEKGKLGRRGVGKKEEEYTPDNAVSAPADGTNRRHILSRDFKKVAEDVVVHVVTIVRRYSCDTSTTLRQIHRTTPSSSSSCVVSFYPLRHSHLLVAFVSLQLSVLFTRLYVWSVRPSSIHEGTTDYYSVSSTNNTKASNKASIIDPPLSTILLFRSFAELLVPSVTFGATRGSLGWNYLLSVHPSSFAYDMEDYSGVFKFCRVRDPWWMKNCVESPKCVWHCYGGPEWFQTFCQVQESSWMKLLLVHPSTFCLGYGGQNGFKVCPL